MQKAEISDVQIKSDHLGSTSERAHGKVVSHPYVGCRGLYVGGPIITSPIVKKFKNGNFVTLNTHYRVVKRSTDEAI